MKDEAANALLSMRPDGFDELSISGVPGINDTILFIRDTGMGDILLTTPIIRKLHEMGATVDYAVNQAHIPILEHNPFIRNVFQLEGFDWNNEDYSYVIDMRRVSENAEATGFKGHRIVAFGNAVDVPIADEDLYLNYYPTSEELFEGKDKIVDLFDQSRLNKVIAFGWRASWEQRNLSDDRKVSLIMALLYNGYSVVVLHDVPITFPGFESIQEMPGLHSFAGQLTLRETGGVLYNCSAAIMPDSGLAHLAAALNVPTVEFMGPFPPESRNTIMDKLVVLNEPEKCSIWPCRSYRCRRKEEDGTASCIAIDNTKFLNAIEKVLS